jgi:5-methyltetrahydrofolate--homocysteine methyltransferase
MKLDGREEAFVVIGENIHTTRIVLRRGKHVTNTPDGAEAIRFLNAGEEERFLLIGDDIKKTQDYEEGRVKHMQIAVRAAMKGDEPQASLGAEYLRLQIQRQVNAGADYLDINVDEISIREHEQQDAMRWLVAFVQEHSPIPLSVDSSNTDTIEVGLKACDNRAGRTMLNSASLERLSALDLVREYNSVVIVTAAGESGMPQNAEQRIDHASRMVDAAVERGIDLSDIFIDPLMFPISVNTDSGNHVFDAISELRRKYGPDIHITGGFSNVSFGLPCRRLINDVFAILAIEAGADSGIIDPVASSPRHAFATDRSSIAFEHAKAMLLGGDPDCKAFLKAFRKKQFEGY